MTQITTSVRHRGVGSTGQNLLKAAYVLGEESMDLIYSEEIRAKLEKLADFSAGSIPSQDLSLRVDELKEVEVIFSGWSMVPLTGDLLDKLPKLKAVFYGAGSVRYFITDEFWKRKIRLTSSYAANAIPVTEYTTAAILLSLKQFWRYSRNVKDRSSWGGHTRPLAGNYHSKVGLVSCGMIARGTIKHLQAFDLNMSVYCPFLSDYEANNLRVHKKSLMEIFEQSDLVSLHTPDLPETKGMIGREHFEAMPLNATFINTARGSVVREADLIAVAKERTDLTFVLDVMIEEPPAEDADILNLPNIVVSPHIAGSMGPEIGRLGEFMLLEFKRFLAGKPLRWEVDERTIQHMA